MLRRSRCLHHFEEKLGIHHGEMTEEQVLVGTHVECLGSCGTAPMAMVTDDRPNARYFEEMDSAEDVQKALDVLASGKGFSTLERWTPEGDPESTGKRPDLPVGGMEHPVLTARVFKPDSQKIETYMADGGYETARKVLTSMTPEAIVDQVKARASAPRRRRLPNGPKVELPGPSHARYLVVNADESEPGTFKDRIIMEYDPHQLIEGVILSSFAIRPSAAYIYIRGEYYFAYIRLVEAIDEATAKGFVGEDLRHRRQPADRCASRRRRL